MLTPSEYLQSLQTAGVGYFSGVPDSLLKEICACITDSLPPERHVIAANEGASVGLAIGHHLGTGELPLVYMQNSGLGNAVNPLLSLASPDIYGVPMLVMIGWRGEPGHKDEPQHLHQGRVMLDMLDAMGIAYGILSDDPAKAHAQTLDLAQQARASEAPVAIVVRKGTFAPYKSATSTAQSPYPMTREEAIVAAANALPEDAAVIGTTGMPSRELFEHRARNGLGHQRDFLTVGGMGHASSIALGLARARPDRRVYCFDGDGALLMHMGSLAISGQSAAPNLVHLVFNNGMHGSVGGQPTVAFDIDIPAIAAACGYQTTAQVTEKAQLDAALSHAADTTSSTLIEIRVKGGARSDLGRPTTTPAENKHALMEFLKD